VRRAKLIWFALGVAATTIVAVFARQFAPVPEQPEIAFLELIEPERPGAQDKVRDEDMIANATGELARNCGAKFFETTFLYNDHSPTMEIALVPANKKAVDCILAETAKRAIQTNIIYRKATNAQTH
jgi:hypothetical protein